MIKTVAIAIFLFLVVIIGVDFLIEEKKEDVPELKIQYTRGMRVVRILDEWERLVFSYSVDDFAEWMKENWDDLFEEPPSFGDMREVDPDNFYSFSSAAFSPKSNFIAFSTSDYAVATDISFIGVVNIETEEVRAIRDKNIGSVSDMVWSPQETHIAYILDTARAPGEYLSVDSIISRKKEFTISYEDFLDEDEESDYFNPNFRNLEWVNEGSELTFIADTKEESEVKWIIEAGGFNLRKKEQFAL